MIYKRGNVYWYKFVFNGVLYRESTKQGNDKVARSMESAHRTSLAKGEVGIREKKPAPTLAEFIQNRFEPWAKASFERPSPKTWFDWYRPNLRTIVKYKKLAGLPLDQITTERVAAFAGYRQSKGLQVSTVNSSLRVVRRILNMAVEWGELTGAPKIKTFRGEKHRERVVTVEEEARYLAAAPLRLAAVVMVLVDTGLRPAEAYALRWEYITWSNGRHGTLLITHGKSPAARRIIPMTPRVRRALHAQWEAAGKPEEGWVWPSETASGHIDRSTLKKQHDAVFVTIAEQAKKDRLAPVRRFVIYELRHTFLTRLGMSGCDAWTHARIAGHSDIRVSMRYVHPPEDAVLAAMSRLEGGHKSGHNPEMPQLPAATPAITQ